MSRGSHVIAFGGEGQNSTGADSTPLELQDSARAEAEWPEAEEYEELPPRDRSWIVPALAMAAIALWTMFFVWTRIAELARPADAEQWSAWITAWSLPVVLVCLVWLLAMRNSRREAGRFGDAARALGEESVRLEDRLVSVNRELSLAREFIAAQSRDLEALGRMSVERISQHADRLQALIRDNGAQVDAIGHVSATGLENMERLRAQLPVIASSAKDVTNNIGNVGRAAQVQLQELVAGFKRLNEFGQASERQVSAVRDQFGSAIAEFTHQAEQLAGIADSRFAALSKQGAEFRAQLEAHEVEALASIRTRASALGEELENSRQLLEGEEAERLTSLRARLSAVRDESGAIARALSEAEDAAVTGWRGQLERMNEDLRGALATIEMADKQAMETARRRLHELVDEATRLDTQLAERNRRLDAELAQRRADAEHAETAAAEHLSEQLGRVDEELATRRAAAERAQADAAARVSEQLALIEEEIATRRERHERQTTALLANGEAISGRLREFEASLDRITHHGDDTQQRLATGLQVLADKLDSSRAALVGTDREIAALTDASVRLLELIQTGVRHSREDLPTALASGEDQLAGMESRIFALGEAVDRAHSGGESLSNYVLSTHENLGTAREEASRLYDTVAERAAEHGRVLDRLHASLAALGDESRAVSDSARTELVAAIDLLSGSAHEAVASLETTTAAAVTALAGRIGAESGQAIDRAMHTTAAEVTGKLEQAAAHAAGVSREAAIQLRDQLAKVNELAGNLEQRVAYAREKAEEQVGNDFARRVALITESLNSHAIDVAKALSTDVSDTAWAAYLRGDRGIFTRRAVSLLETGEARAVAQLYHDDGPFREHVSRYIHDFEAMLRQLLSTRDGHALGVTMLSSDMGKLYVALAQAIERLRK